VKTRDSLLDKAAASHFVTDSAEETLQLGQWLGKQLKPDDVLCFTGDLGAGKTCFIKGLINAVTGTPVDAVTSPTFVTLNSYSGPTPVHHFDCYRLDNPQQFIHQGFEEFLDAGGICCIEWPDRIKSLIPENHIDVFLSYNGPATRKISIQRIGEQEHA
jgi:tRNA threonylcarbamoyladenosine biosynthesis protein TsaE